MIHTGTIMDISKSRAYIFTKTCDTVLIKTKNEYLLGQQVTFSNKDIVPAMRTPRLFNHSVMAAAVLFILVVSAALYGIFGFHAKPAFDATCAAVISIDINPSIELSINKENQIIDIVYANAQGQAIFDQLDLKTKLVNDGIDQIIVFAKENGYLQDNAILFISAAPNEVFSQSGEAQLKEVLTTAEKNEGADIVTVYIDDFEIIDEAEEIDISIGRLLLHKYAEDYGFSISLQEIKDGSISEIFSRLRLNGETDPLLQEPTQSETTPPETTPPETSPSAIATPSAEPSAEPSPIVTPSANAFTANVRVSAGENGITVSWNKAPSAVGFSYYKIVASSSNKSPVYPDDGYAAAISKLDKTSAFIKSGSGYNHGDVGGALEGGKTYYFSVTYVYEDTVIRGNAVKITMPTAPEASPSPTPQSSFTPKLTTAISDGKIKFSWTPLSGSSVAYNNTTYKNFSYYKVVASQTDSTPVYPDNGYLYVGSSYNSSSWSVDPAGSDYNQSPTLEPGVKYYFAITYVFENGKFTSNTVSATVPAYEEPPAETAPAFSAPQLAVSANASALNFNWTSIPDSSVTYSGKAYSGFNYYKIVASQTDSTPVYPDNGYLYYASDLGTTSWSVDPSTGDYNESPTLEAGKTYYFAVTYVFDNGKFVSNTVTATVPGYSAPTAPTFSTPTLSVSADGGNLMFSWSNPPGDTVVYNGTSYEGFKYYKVVASETNPQPIYPNDGYIHVLSDQGITSWSTDPASAGLESGKTYYFAITYVFKNGKFVSNTVQLTAP